MKSASRWTLRGNFQVGGTSRADAFFHRRRARAKLTGMWSRWPTFSEFFVPLLLVPVFVSILVPALVPKPVPAPILVPVLVDYIAVLGAVFGTVTNISSM